MTSIAAATVSRQPAAYVAAAAPEFDPIVLTDGARLHVRPIRPSDKEGLAREFRRLSPESRRRRFLLPKPELSDAELHRLTAVDHHSHEALVAIEPQSGRGVAVARFAGYPGEPGRSEFAITVADDWQGRGVGRALSGRLLIRARDEGVRLLEATTLADNRQALVLLRALGFQLSSFEDGLANLRLCLQPQIEHAEAA